MTKQDAAEAWLSHYRKTLEYIRHTEVPFTRVWRLCNTTLQTVPEDLRKPEPVKITQLELFP